MKILNLLAVFMLVLGGSVMAGCDVNEGPVEEAAESVDNAVDEAGDAVEDTVEDAGDALEEAGDKLEDKRNRYDFVYDKDVSIVE